MYYSEINAMTTLVQIEKFLAHKRLAMVGVSSNPKDFSRGLFQELRRRQYDVVPVHPHASEIDGVACCRRVEDIHPQVEAALLMTAPGVTADVVRQCQAAGIRSVWMYRAGGSGAVSPEAVAFCAENGMALVAGECPFMFLPETAWFHRFHGLCRKVLGAYPTPA